MPKTIRILNSRVCKMSSKDPFNYNVLLKINCKFKHAPKCMCMGESRVIGHNSNNEIERMKTSFNTD